MDMEGRNLIQMRSTSNFLSYLISVLFPSVLWWVYTIFAFVDTSTSLFSTTVMKCLRQVNFIKKNAYLISYLEAKIQD